MREGCGEKAKNSGKRPAKRPGRAGKQTRTERETDIGGSGRARQVHSRGVRQGEILAKKKRDTERKSFGTKTTCRVQNPDIPVVCRVGVAGLGAHSMFASETSLTFFSSKFGGGPSGRVPRDTKRRNCVCKIHRWKNEIRG